jgi:hypothetical protein
VDEEQPDPCAGPMRWWPVPPSQAEKDAGAVAHALIDCEACTYLVVSPTLHDRAHWKTRLLMGRGIDQGGRAG